MRPLAAVLTCAALAAAAASLPTPALAADPLRDASCDTLFGGTVNSRDLVPAAQIPEAGSLTQWPAAPTAAGLPARVALRGRTETYNSRYAFATRGGALYVAHVSPDAAGWRRVPLPACLDGRVSSISADDDELIALDADRRVFVMDNALKGPDLFNWTRRWGLPFWTGKGRTLPVGVLAWSWSVLSPAQDVTWSDDAGNAHAVGDDKVSHIWALRSGGQRLTFMDPWLANDDSYEMCGPHRGRFRAVNLSASGSTVFVIGAHGDVYTRLYDFDLAGHDAVFFDYSYEPQRRGDASAPIQLPSPGWVRQPKVPGAITSAISVAKTGTGAVHRTLRVEGLDARGRTGYWEKDIISASPSAWRFHATGRPLQGRRLDNPARDTSEAGLGPAADLRFAGRDGALRIAVEDYNVHCTPSTLRLTAGGRSVALRLHSVDGLRGTISSPRLGAAPRDQYGNVEVPASVLAHRATLPAAIKAFLATKLKDKRFTTVSLHVTSSALKVDELGWTLTR
ncbi:MAG TPA: hypothetical protein VNT55_02540 [Baekduia sp.]|nr:hypothetical protein [Baekduia sp.]